MSSGRMEVDSASAEIDWFTENEPDSSAKASRKRKADSISFSDLLDCFSDGPDSDDYDDESSLYFNVSNRVDCAQPNKKSPRLVDSLLTGATETAMTNQDIVEQLMKYLPQEVLRSIVTVSNLWRRTAVTEIQNRIGDHPYLLRWKSEGQTSFSYRRFVKPLDSQNKRIGRSPLQSVIFFATSSMEDWPFPLGERDFLPPGVQSSAFFCDKVMVMAPNCNFLTEVDCKKFGNNVHAIQALCVPASPSFTIRTFSVPSRSFFDEEKKCIPMSFAAPITPPPLGQSLKGMVLAEYHIDQVVTDLIVDRLRMEGRNVPMIGGIVSSLTSDDKPVDSAFTVAGGFAIYGDEDVRVSTLGVQFDGDFELELIFDHIIQFFHECRDGFMLFAYDKLSDLETTMIKTRLRKTLPYIPIVGFQTYNDTGLSCFSGKILRKSRRPELVFYPDQRKDIKMSIMLVAY